MLRQVCNVETIARQHVAVAERIRFAIGLRIEPLVDLDVNLSIDVFQTRIAWSMCPRVHAALNRQHPVGVPKLETNPGGLWERDALEWLDLDLVVDQHELASAGEQATDIDFMRTAHDTNAVAV